MYSQGFREAVKKAYLFIKNYRKTASIFELAVSTVFRWCNGYVVTTRTRLASTGTLTKWVTGVLDESAFCTLEHLKQQALDKLQIHTSTKRLSNCITSAGYSKKRCRYCVCASDTASKCERFREHFRTIDVSKLYALDEMGTSEKTLPLYGYSKRGHRTRIVQSKGSWRNISSIACISVRGGVQHKFQKKSFDTASFCQFIRGIDIPRGSILLMDNVSFHHSKESKASMEEMGITPLYIPPYSPDFNPIENVFSVVKNTIRKLISDKCAVVKAVSTAFSQISAEVVRSCFKRSIEFSSNTRGSHTSSQFVS